MPKNNMSKSNMSKAPIIQMSGMTGLKKLSLKISLNTTNISILAIYRLLVLESLEKFIVRIGKIPTNTLH